MVFIVDTDIVDTELKIKQNKKGLKTLAKNRKE